MMFELPLDCGAAALLIALLPLDASLLSAAQPAVATVKNNAIGTTLRIERFKMIPRSVRLSRT